MCWKNSFFRGRGQNWSTLLIDSILWQEATNLICKLFQLNHGKNKKIRQSFKKLERFHKELKRADRLKPNSRLDDLINILEEIIDTVYSRKGVTRQLNLPNVEKSVAFKRYELFHPKDKSVYDNYDIRINKNNHDDQSRVVTPKEAFSIGSDFIVMGRPLISLYFYSIFNNKIQTNRLSWPNNSSPMPWNWTQTVFL